jgi:H+/Cl- antiporter ClcA
VTDEAPSGAAYLRLVALAAAIGVPAALVAALFLAAVHGVEDWLWDDPAWYLIVGLPVVGAGIVAAARALLPGDGGHAPLHGLSTAPTPLAHAPGVALAALGTLCFGAVLGPEAPLIALGSAVGLTVTLFVRLAPKESALMSGAGSFAAISALFGGPLVGGVLMVEAGAAGLGAALLPALLPGFVAAAVGYLLFVGFGDWGGLDAPGLAVPDLPAYEGTHLYDLLVALAVGVAAALTIAGVRRLAEGVARTPRLGMPGLLLAGGLPVVWFDVSPTLAVAVGAAAGMAATTRLLLTPMLFAALLAGTPGLDAVPAAVLAAAAAWLTVQALERPAARA